MTRPGTRLALFVAAALSLQSVHAARFRDLEVTSCEYGGYCEPSAHSYSEAIESLARNGIVHGYPDGTFRPDDKINRAEFTKIVVLSRFSAAEVDACEKNSTSWSPRMKDVPPGAWYSKYVCMGVLHADIRGYPDGTFQPGNPITFVEAAKILANTYAQPAHGQHEDWFEPYVDALGKARAIPQAVDAFEYRITRGDMAEMLYRLRERRTDLPSRQFVELASQTIGFLGQYRLQRFESNSEVQDFVFTKDFSKVAFEGIKSDGAAFMFNGTTFEFPHDWQLGGVQPVFSDDGRQLAYFIGTNERAVVMNGVEGKTYDHAWDLRYLPSEETFVYWAKQGNESILVKGATEMDRYTSVAGPPVAGGLQVGPDGRTLAYHVLQPYGNFFVVGDQKQKVFSTGNGAIDFRSLRFSADGRSFAYIVRNDTGYSVVHENREYGPYEDYHSGVAISADGQHVAFVAKEEGNSVVVYDGQEVAAFAQPVKPVFHPDGSLLFAARRTGEDPIRIYSYDDNRVSERVTLRASEEVRDIVISPDGEHIAVQTLDHQRAAPLMMLIDGVYGPPLWNVEPFGVRFLYNHHAYVTGHGSDYSIVVDHRVSKKRFRFIPSLPIFSQDGRYVTYGAFDGYAFHRVVEKVEEVGI